MNEAETLELEAAIAEEEQLQWGRLMNEAETRQNEPLAGEENSFNGAAS